MEDTILLHDFVSTRSPQAFERLAAKYQPMIRASALRQLRDASAADDVTQAVLLTLMNKASQLPANVRLGAWLHHVTRCHAVDLRRAQSIRQKHEHAAATLRSQTANDTDDRSCRLDELIDEALGALRDGDRDLLVSYYLQGQSADEISRTAGIRPVAIRKRISRALLKLRNELRGRNFQIEVVALEGFLIHRIAGRLSVPTAIQASSGIVSILTGAKVAAALLVAGGTVAVVVHEKMKSQTVAMIKTPTAIHSQPRSLSTTTPLIQAVQHHDIAAVTRLLDGGVKVDEISRDGNNTSALLYAATMPGDTGLPITRLLVQHGADVNIRHGQWGYTAAMVAARNGSPRTVQFLADHGAMLDVADRHGQTMTTMAEASGNVAVIRLVQTLRGS